MIVHPIRFEHHETAFGIGTGTPRLSWLVETADQEWRQRAYELELNGATRIRVESGERVLVPWPFAPLPSRTSARLRVRVSDGAEWSAWSEPAWVETGPLDESDWSARFISPRRLGGLGAPAPLLRRELELRGPVVSARLYATAHGLYRAWINGQRVGDIELAPGWTSYQHRLRYHSYEVTKLLKPGHNELEVLLGNGWFRGRLGPAAPGELYGERLALLAQLEVSFSDGSRAVIGTDEQWSARNSQILTDDLYDGQHTDLRVRPAESTSDTVELLPERLDRLVAPECPPVRITGTLPVQRHWDTDSGGRIVDFGQNLVGWVRIRLPGTSAGTTVTVGHAEVLEHGELCTRPLRGAKARDSYVLDEQNGEVVLEPCFTFHGFRYAEISGARPDPDSITAVILGSDLRRTGWFHCSDALLNRFHENVIWSMRGNFLDVPTDCPQRDERLGWTGDIQAFAPTASFLFHTAGFLSSWLADLAAEQQDDGSVPFVIPDVLREPGPTAAAWGDAAVFVPWTLYWRYGDRELLARQLPSMRAWVDKLTTLTEDGVRAGGFQFGDWLDPNAPPDDPFATWADADVLATAYLARSAEILAASTELLGQDGGNYARLAERTRAAFARAYLTSEGRLRSDAPSVYVLALAWALLPEASDREAAARRLVELVRAGNHRISTGFIGTPLIGDALCQAGYPEDAVALLLRRECPSWLYPVTMGASTVWERWDSLLPDGSINPGEMTSFNHYALGAIADWMHRELAGLAPAEPGYRRIAVRPFPTAELRHASARHETPYGTAEVSWRREDGRLLVLLTVPPGATAYVRLPGTEAVELGHGEHSWDLPDPVSARPSDS